MASKRKANDTDSSSVAQKRGRAATNAASSSKKGGPIDLTSDSDSSDHDDTTAGGAVAAKKSTIINNANSKSKSNGNSNNGSNNNGDTKSNSNGDKAAVPPHVVAVASSSSSSINGQSVAETKKPAVAPPVGSPPTASAGSYKDSEAYRAALTNNQKGIKRLATEFARLGTVKEYTVSLVDNDLFLWEIKIPFDASTTLGQDLATYSPNDRNVLIRMSFDTTHPFKAPFVRVRSPRFLKGSSNVMEGGAICMDTFSQIGWSPAMTAEKSILAIQSLLCTAGLNVRLDPVNHAREYTEEEGKRSYAYVLQAHKEWDQTGSYNGGTPVPQMPAAAVLPPANARAPAAAKKR